MATGTNIRIQLGGGAAGFATYQERTAWEEAVGGDDAFTPCDILAQLDPEDVLAAGSPLTVGDGITLTSNKNLTCNDFSALPWDDGYAATPDAALYFTGTPIILTFSAAPGAFAIEGHHTTALKTLTATLSDDTVMIEASVGTTGGVHTAGFFGWIGGGITSIQIAIGSVPYLLWLGLLKVRAAAVAGGAPALLRRAVDLAVTTSSINYSRTDTDVPAGESFPQDIEANKVFTFTDRPTATARVWRINRGAAITTPAGSTWTYGIGSHADTWTYPNVPPANYTFYGEPLATTVWITNQNAGAAMTIDQVDCQVTYGGTETPASSVSGREMADAIYNLEVCADVEGHKDTSGGAYTGTAYALITRPADVLRHFAATYLGWTVADRFDADTFAAARAAEAAAGIRLDFTLLEPTESRAFFDRIREQTCSAHLLGADGKYKRYLFPFSNVIRGTFTEAENLLEPIQVGLTSIDDLVNQLALRYRPDPFSGDYWGLVELNDATSKGTGNPPTPGYNVTHKWEPLFDLLRDSTAAAAVAAAWLSWLKDQRYQVRLVVRAEWIHLEPWDLIQVTSARMPGGWVAKPFLIQTVRKLLGDPSSPDRIELIARAVS